MHDGWLVASTHQSWLWCAFMVWQHSMLACLTESEDSCWVCLCMQTYPHAWHRLLYIGPDREGKVVRPWHLCATVWWGYYLVDIRYPLLSRVSIVARDVEHRASACVSSPVLCLSSEKLSPQHTTSGAPCARAFIDIRSCSLVRGKNLCCTR